ncbi:MAG: class I lanthipeptide [Hyphomicrobiales bacterium]
MKKKNLKLNFNKQTIAKLNPSEQNQIVGASDIPCTVTCICTLETFDCLNTCVYCTPLDTLSNVPCPITNNNY